MWLWLPAAVMLLVAGCATPQWNTGFPEVHLQKPKSGALVIGVAQAEDSRASQVIGMRGRAELLAGPELGNYIERKFRNGLTDWGFDSVEALDPAKTSVKQPYKVLVVTLRSARFSWSGMLSGAAESTIGIAVKVYSPASKLIYSRDFTGNSSARAHMIKTGVAAGDLVAPAADEAVSSAFADPQFEKALR